MEKVQWNSINKKQNGLKYSKNDKSSTLQRSIGEAKFISHETTLKYLMFDRPVRRTMSTESALRPLSSGAVTSPRSFTQSTAARHSSSRCVGVRGTRGPRITRSRNTPANAPADNIDERAPIHLFCCKFKYNMHMLQLIMLGMQYCAQLLEGSPPATLQMIHQWACRNCRSVDRQDQSASSACTCVIGRTYRSVWWYTRIHFPLRRNSQSFTFFAQAALTRNLSLTNVNYSLINYCTTISRIKYNPV